MKLKNIFAYYVPFQDKIYGVTLEESKLIYFHESRHRQQFKSGMMNYLMMPLEVTIPLSLIVICITNNFKLSLLIFFTWWFSMFIIELDAWIYAIIMYKKC